VNPGTGGDNIVVHPSQIIRQPVVAGQFYPGDPASLRTQVRELLEEAEPGEAVGLGSADRSAAGTDHALLVMVPHAGYVYSGRVAGHTLRSARLAETIVLLGPNHTGMGAPISVWPGGEWRTPLGAVPVDAELATCLCTSDAVFTPDTAAHTHEHSIEVVLPFLQVLQPGVRIVPIAVGAGDPEVLARCGAALARCLKTYPSPVTLVVSSDMSHYVSHEQARRDDMLALAMVESVDPEGLYTTVRSRGITMCGVFPMTVGLVACRLMGAQKGRLLSYATSGEVSGDMEKVVGYAGAVIPGPAY